MSQSLIQFSPPDPRLHKDWQGFAAALNVQLKKIFQSLVRGEEAASVVSEEDLASAFLLEIARADAAYDPIGAAANAITVANDYTDTQISGITSLAAYVVTDDPLLSAASHTNLPTEYAAKTYIDTAIAAATSFTAVGEALTQIPDPGAVVFLRVNADNSVSARSGTDFRTDLGLGTGDSPTFLAVNSSTTLNLLSTAYSWAGGPSLAFGDGDTGFSESADDVLLGRVGGTNIWSLEANGMSSLIKTVRNKVTAHGAMGATETFDASATLVHTGTLDAACTFTLSNPAASGEETVLTLYILQDGTGGFAITWPASVKWDPAAPAVVTTANSLTTYVLTTTDNGTTWLGNIVATGVV